jgi:hypothetical protein
MEIGVATAADLRRHGDFGAHGGVADVREVRARWAVAAFALNTREVRRGRFALKSEGSAETNGMTGQTGAVLVLFNGFQGIEGLGMAGLLPVHMCRLMAIDAGRGPHVVHRPAIRVIGHLPAAEHAKKAKIFTGQRNVHTRTKSGRAHLFPTVAVGARAVQDLERPLDAEPLHRHHVLGLGYRRNDRVLAQPARDGNGRFDHEVRALDGHGRGSGKGGPERRHDENGRRSRMTNAAGQCATPICGRKIWLLHRSWQGIRIECAETCRSNAPGNHCGVRTCGLRHRRSRTSV